MVEDHRLGVLRRADRRHQFRTETWQSVLVGDDQLPGLPADHRIQQALESLLLVVHAQAQIGNDHKRPAALGTAEFESLFLPFHPSGRD
ncbi:MAG: hypothetical protein FD153_1573 [Rhodospirillaceae bacterium]|nr:MAG: hypothetical protein FD153_1573 [Rhodospirillaceae bacterium]